MKTLDTTFGFRRLFFFFSFIFSVWNVQAQYCDSVVPTMNVDLTASPYMSWTSPGIVRDGLCCGASNPDNCLEFVITLHPNTIAISFDIASGAIPPGALYYQIDCGPATPVGQPICISGVGPHHLTFCKPGNNNNSFSVTAYPDPMIGPDITLNSGCQGFIYANFYNEPSMSWTSIAPGAVGAYDGLLSCTSGCDTTYVNAPSNPPAYVDYLVCGNDIGGCNPNPICDTIRVNFVSPVTVDIDIDTAYRCFGDPSILMTASVAGGTPPYNINWSSGSSSNTENGISGVYTVFVTDNSGCLIASDSALIIENPLPLVNAGPDQFVCDGAPVTLSGAGAVNYVWNNGVTNGVPFMQAVGTTTYTVTGTDINGCQNTDQVEVTVWALPNVNAGLDQTVCDGTAVTLSGSGAVNYAWDNGVLDGVPFLQGVGTTTYTVIGTDNNGCQSTDQVDILVNPLPVVNAGPDQSVCAGVAVTLSGSGAVNYLWDNGISNGVPFVQGTGTITYTVTGTDANGCQNTDQVDVNVWALPNVSAGADQQACFGSAITLTGNGASNYAWDQGVTNGVPFGQGVGTITYTVIGTDVNGCQNTDQVDVTIWALPNVNAGSDQIVCENVQVTLNGAGAINYIWDNGVMNGVPFFPPLGTTVYNVIGTDANGCSGSDQVQVTVNLLPVVSAGTDQMVCDGVAVTLSGSGAQNYAWDNGVSNGIPFIQSVGTTTYTVIGTDVNGCQNTDQVNVTVWALPNVSAGMDQTICEGTDVTLNGSGALNYSWDNGVTDGVAFVQGVGVTTYTVTGTDANGCQNTDQVIVTVGALPTPNAGPDQTVCENTAVTLNSQGGPQLAWTNGVQNGVPFIQGLGTTTYVVYDTTAIGCTGSDTVQITVLPNPVVTANGAEICFGEEVTLFGQGAVMYAWSGGIQNGMAFSPQQSGIYVVTGIGANGCSDQDSVFVLVHQNPLAAFDILNDDISTIEPITGFNNTSIGGSTYVWNFGDGTSNSSEFEPTHEFPSEEGSMYQITLTVTSPHGCVDEFIRYINIKQDYNIFVPNAFTPDGNGKNEIFLPILDGFEEEGYTLYVFNRWGQLVFESHDQYVGWDGTFAGQDFQTQDGVYSWKVIARVKNSSERKQYVGHVSLLK